MSRCQGCTVLGFETAEPVKGTYVILHLSWEHLVAILFAQKFQLLETEGLERTTPQWWNVGRKGENYEKDKFQWLWCVNGRNLKTKCEILFCSLVACLLINSSFSRALAVGSHLLYVWSCSIPVPFFWNAFLIRPPFLHFLVKHRQYGVEYQCLNCGSPAY